MFACIIELYFTFQTEDSCDYQNQDRASEYKYLKFNIRKERNTDNQAG